MIVLRIQKWWEVLDHVSWSTRCQRRQPTDIIKTSLFYRSQTVHLSLPPFSPSVSGNQKALPTRGKQGGKIVVRFVTCSPPDYPSLLRGIAHDTTWIAQG